MTDDDTITLTDKGRAVVSELEKQKLWEDRIPPRFERNCALWPMCMCQKQCEASK